MSSFFMRDVSLELFVVGQLLGIRCETRRSQKPTAIHARA